MIFGINEHERLLSACFAEQYGPQAGPELESFFKNLQGIALPFDLAAQIRQQDYPGFPGFECGLPSKFSYYVPGSNYGGHNAVPDVPLDLSFVYAVDGIGLNFGCPIRLKRALEVLHSLAPEDQIEARQSLATSNKHLSMVEELISAGMWLPSARLSRPPKTTGRNHDWTIRLSDLTIHQECKFVPASWAALVDGDDFELMKGTLAGKASTQLPPKGAPKHINVVSVTGLTPVHDSLRRLCADDLRDYPNVEAIVYASLAGEITVLSLSADIARAVQEEIELRPADQFGGFSTVAHFRPEAERRRANRKAVPFLRELRQPVELAEIKVDSLRPRKIRYAPPEAYPYRFALKERLRSGEPKLEWVPPFLKVPAPSRSAPASP